MGTNEGEAQGPGPDRKPLPRFTQAIVVRCKYCGGLVDKKALKTHSCKCSGCGQRVGSREKEHFCLRGKNYLRRSGFVPCNRCKKLTHKTDLYCWNCNEILL